MRLRVDTFVERLLPETSSRWLVYALVSTFIIVLGGSFLMYGLFRSRTVETSAAVDMPQQALTVLVDRTPGGPSQWTPYIPVLIQMQEQMRVPVRAKYVSGRRAVADALESPEVDAAFVSIFQYVAMSEDSRFELLATPVVDGSATDSAVVVVDARSPYRTFEDLRGTRIALAPGASIRGFAYANYLAIMAGSTLDDYFERVDAGGEHVENLQSLADGEVDVAAVGRTHLLAWPPGTFRIVAQSPEMGLPPLIVSTRLPEYFRENLRDALSRMTPGNGLPADGLVEGFVLPGREDYEFAFLLKEYADARVAEPQWGGSR
jgi:ABC-type phosphate/phosphonate transport system substrate-binding protein